MIPLFCEPGPEFIEIKKSGNWSSNGYCLLIAQLEKAVQVHDCNKLPNTAP